jgi:WD40 repeat protein
MKKIWVVISVLVIFGGAALIAVELATKEDGATQVTANLSQQLYAFSALNFTHGDSGDVTDIMEGQKRVATQPGVNSTFSPDGRYVLSSTSESLYVYDTLSGREYSHPLIYQPPEGCISKPIGDKYIYIADPQLTRYSLPEFTDPVHLKTSLPSGPICTVAVAGDDALVVVNAKTGWQLYEVDSLGRSKHLGPTPLRPAWDWGALASSEFAPIGRASNGDAEIAYELFENNSGPRIFVLDIRTNSVFEVGAAELGMSESAIRRADSLYLGSLWWANDGCLYAVMSSYKGNDLVSSQKIWKLVGKSWALRNKEAVVDTRPLRGGDVLTIAPESGYLERPWGDLYLESKGKKQVLIRKQSMGISVPLEETEPPPNSIS